MSHTTFSPAALSRVLDNASAAFNTTRAELDGWPTPRKVVVARFAAAWVARQALAASFSQIGGQMGGRDHSTAFNAVRRAEQLREQDAAFRSITDRLLAQHRRGPQ